MEMDITTGSPEETIDLGRKIGSQLAGGEILAICGTLGTGKTHLIKGIAAGAGADDCSAVNSPTFVMVNEYSGRLDIYHIDAYRTESVREFELLGFDDFCHPDSVVLIEWAEKVAEVLEGTNCIWVELKHVSRSERNICAKNLPEHIHC